MATVIRELLVRFGVKAETKPVERFERSVEGAKRGLMGARTAATQLAGRTGLGQLGESMERVAAAGSRLKGILAGILTGATAANILDTASSFETMMAAFERAGGTAEDLERLREATANTVSNDDLVRMSNLANSFKITREEVLGLTEIARGATAELGGSIKTNFEDILTGSARQSKQIIDNLGIMVNVNAANEKMAKKLGKSVKKLTDEEKKRAFIAEVVANAEDKRASAQLITEGGMGTLRAETRNLFVQTSVLLAKGLNPFVNILIKLVRKLKEGVRALDAWAQRIAKNTRLMFQLKTGAKLAGVAVAAVVTAKTLSSMRQLAKTIAIATRAYRSLGLAATIAKAQILIIPGIIAIMILLIEDFITFLKGGASFTGDFAEKFKDAEGAAGFFARALLGIKEGISVLATLKPPLIAALSILRILGALLIGTIAPILEELGRQALAFAKEQLPAIKEAAEAAFEVLKRRLEEARELFFDGLAGAQEAIRTLAPFVKKTLISLFNAMRGIVVRVVPIVLKVVDKVFTIVMRLVRILVPPIARLVGALIMIASPLVDFISSVVNTTLDMLNTFVSLALPVARGFIEKLAGEIKFIIDVVAFVLSTFGPPVLAFGAKIVDFIGLIVTLTKGSIDLLMPLITGAFDIMKGILDGIVDVFKTLIGFADKMINKVATAVGKLKELIGLGDEQAAEINEGKLGQALAASVSVPALESLRKAGEQARAAAAGAVTNNTSATTNNVTATVNIQGTTNMGSRAVQGATAAGMEKALKGAARAAGN